MCKRKGIRIIIGCRFPLLLTNMSGQLIKDTEKLGGIFIKIFENRSRLQEYQNFLGLQQELKESKKFR